MNLGRKASILGAAALLTMAAYVVGCGDTGDSSAPPGDGDAAGADGGATEEGNEGDGTTGPDSTVTSGQDGSSTSQDAMSQQDAGSSESETGSSQPETGTSQEAGGTTPDASPDTGSTGEDSGVVDASTQDVVEAGENVDATVEAGGPDAAAEASTGTEAGTDGGHDAATHDAASEAGSEGGGLVPCTTSGQTGCVKCEGNETGSGSNGGVCTPTEAAFVQFDISKGLATAAGNDPTTGCYSCLYQYGCIDDTVYGDSDNECGDTLTSGTPTECLTTLSCVLSTSCAEVSAGDYAVVNCYCGTAPSSGSCNNAAPNGAANGACSSDIAAGNGFAVDDGHDNLVNLENPALPSGKADQIFQCAISNDCTMCLQ